MSCVALFPIHFPPQSWILNCSQLLNGLSTTTSRASSWASMSSGKLPDSCLDYKLCVFMCCVKWILKAAKTTIHLFFRREAVIPCHTSLGHSAMSSSVIHHFSLHLNICNSTRFFLLEDSFPFSVISVVSSLPSARTESITLVFRNELFLVFMFCCFEKNWFWLYVPIAALVSISKISFHLRYWFVLRSRHVFGQVYHMTLVCC